jgi:ABC-2 type transport system ATP-binding protein
MSQVALAMDVSLADGYLTEIEHQIEQDLLQDALDKLQDFVRDFVPQLSHDVVLLRGRFRRLTADVRRGLARREDLDAVPPRVLELAAEAHRAASGRAETRPEPAPAGFPGMGAGARNSGATRPTQAAQVPTGGATVVDLKPGSPSLASMERLDDLRRVYWLQYRRERPPTETVAFKAEGISKAYRKSAFRLEEISFELRAGEITGVVGRNASGKTTLLRIVMGDLLPDTGKTSYPMLTRDRSGWAHIKRQIADVPQSPPKWHGRLRPNLNYVAAMHGVKGKRNRELIDWHVERYGLADYENATWDEISGGYQTRFELVRALISSPRLLVLDEPLAFLDVMARQDFLKNLRAIAASLEAPVAIIITSQHLYEIEAVADQMILLDDGKCLYAGPQDRIGEQVPDRMIEVTLRVPQPHIKSLLDPLGLKSIETTIEGYIVTFPKETRADAIYGPLYRAYSERLVDFRDITNSARSLLQGGQLRATTGALVL